MGDVPFLLRVLSFSFTGSDDLPDGITNIYCNCPACCRLVGGKAAGRKERASLRLPLPQIPKRAL